MPTVRSPRPIAVTVLLAALLAPDDALARERVAIEIEGLERELRQNVLATLSLEDAKGDDDLSEERIRRLHTRAEEEIELALQPFGYYRPSVQSVLEREGDAWVARYTVDPGPALKVTATDVQVLGEGADDPTFQRLVRDFPLQRGEILYHPDYEQGKAALDDHAA
jgi:translocation and assembly module TamA